MSIDTPLLESSANNTDERDRTAATIHNDTLLHGGGLAEAPHPPARLLTASTSFASPEIPNSSAFAHQQDARHTFSADTPRTNPHSTRPVQSSPACIEDILGPWTSAARYFGLYLHAHASDSHWAEVAHGLLFVGVFITVAILSILNNKETPAKVANCFFVAVSVAYAICAHVLRSGGLHCATAILFQSSISPFLSPESSSSSVSFESPHAGNYLMADVRRDLAHRCRTHYAFWFVLVCGATISVEVYFNLSTSDITWFGVFASCVVAPYALISTAMALLVVPLVSAVHAAAARRLTDAFTNEDAQQEWMALLPNHIASKASASGGDKHTRNQSEMYNRNGECMVLISSVQPLSSHHHAASVSSDVDESESLVSISHNDRPYTIDLLDLALDAIVSHRRALDSTSSALSVLGTCQMGH